VNTYDLHGKTIVEIGAGKGDFLTMLCELGDNRGVGFDPSYEPEPEGSKNERIEFVLDFYSERYADYDADFICCRHVLEHIDRPDEFLTMLRRVIDKRSNTIVFFEVPNAIYTLRELGIWDLIYEHCSYFTPLSLSTIFSQNGFRVLNVNQTFEGQFLTIEAVADQDSILELGRELDGLSNLVASFAKNYRDKVESWQQRLKAYESEGKRVVVWGAGSKGVTFLNVLKTAGTIHCVVDINPRKEGMYVAGTGQKIVEPIFLREYLPDIVVAMNRNYINEIHRELLDLGIRAEVVIA
jgi:hypothetical protein